MVYRAEEVPFVLHQMTKFEHDRHKVIVHSEGDLFMYKDSSIFFIKVGNAVGVPIYQAFNIEDVKHILEENLIQKPQLPSISFMVENEMLRHFLN